MEIIKCEFCGRVGKSIGGNKCHEKFCIENPNRIKGHSIKWTDEQKRRISEKQKENYRNGKSRWHIDRSTMSYAESYFYEFFNTFTVFKSNYWVERFYLDFAWPEKMIYVEINGQQHYTLDYIKRDKERKKILQDLGWTCIDEIKWSWFQSLKKSDKQEFLETLKQNIFNSKILEKKWESRKEKKEKYYLEKYGTKNPGCCYITKKEMLKRYELLKNYDKTKFGWISKASKETGLTRSKIMATCSYFNFEFRTVKRKTLPSRKTLR
jgi:very-short-patch-repair endonuclease